MCFLLSNHSSLKVTGHELKFWDKIQKAELDLLMKTYKNQQVVGKVAIWIPIGQIDDWRERDTANYNVVSLCRCCLSSLLAVLWDHLVPLQDSFFSNRTVFYLVILSSFENNVQMVLRHSHIMLPIYLLYFKFFSSSPLDF